MKKKKKKKIMNISKTGMTSTHGLSHSVKIKEKPALKIDAGFSCADDVRGHIHILEFGNEILKIFIFYVIIFV